MSTVLTVIGEISIVALIGAIVWIIRLEGAVKGNQKEIKRLGAIEAQTHEQEILIKQRDEEMRSIKFSLDELKERVTKVESNQVSTGETLARIEVKLNFVLRGQGVLDIE